MSGYPPKGRSQGGDGRPWGPPGPELPPPAEGPAADRHSPGGRKVLITGGSSGIGAAAAEEFAARGYLVAVAGRDESALDRVARATRGVPVPEWLGWPAWLKGAFPALYRRLERTLDSGDPRDGRRRHGRKRAAVVRPAWPWP